MDERLGLNASDLLQVSTTIAALALALAELGQQRGPRIGEFYALTLALLFVGVVALVSSMYALAQLWDDAGMFGRDLFGGWWRSATARTHVRTSLVWV